MELIHASLLFFPRFKTGCLHVTLWQLSEVLLGDEEGHCSFFQKKLQTSHFVITCSAIFLILCAHSHVLSDK